MTTKEFIRRSDYFNSLDGALIALSGRSFCWRISRVYLNDVSTFFTHDAFYFFDEHPAFFAGVDSVYVEKYSIERFAIDFRYFKAFLSRLSNYQFESLKASGKCAHLLANCQLTTNLNGDSE